MLVLVINSGSSSIKYRLFDMTDESQKASGLLERIGEKKSLLTHQAGADQATVEREVSGHKEGMDLIIETLTADGGAISDRKAINAIGHRVVHGGEDFTDPVIIDGMVLDSVKRNAELAPLHNPPNLTGIEVAMALFPDTPQVAVFDTAFHQTMPAKASRYAIPKEMYEKHGIRRYGFHGTSHKYVAGRAAAMLGKTPADVNVITVHLGNGSSMAAVKAGRCVDTTMGLTPLEGLVMGTRSGDIDPGVILHMAERLGMGPSRINRLLNKESGLLGIAGASDLREVMKKRDGGDRDAELAIKVYAYRIKKYIGAFMAVLGGTDSVAFTAGIGENSAEIRRLSVEGLEALGIELDDKRNNEDVAGEHAISSDKSRVKLLVIPTNEELEIARQTRAVLA